MPAPPIPTGGLKKVITKGDFRKKKDKPNKVTKPKKSKEEKERERELRRKEKQEERERKREIKRKQKEEEKLRKKQLKVSPFFSIHTFSMRINKSWLQNLETG